MALALEEASLTEGTTIGLDLAKSVFQAHGRMRPVRRFRKKLRRDRMVPSSRPNPAA